MVRSTKVQPDISIQLPPTADNLREDYVVTPEINITVASPTGQRSPLDQDFEVEEDGSNIDYEENTSMGIARVDSVYSDLSAVENSKMMRSPSTDALIDKMSRSQTMQFAVMNPFESSERNFDVGAKVILPSQRTVIQDYISRKNFRQARLEWKELKEKSREWLKKADIFTEPDDLFVGVETIDDNEVTLDNDTNASTLKKRTKSNKEESTKGIVVDWIERARLYIKQNNEKRPRTAYTPYRKMSSENQREVRLLIIDFGYAMSIYGIPSHKLEENLRAVCTYYGVDGNFFCTPTGLWYNFGSIMDDDDVSGSDVHHNNYAFFIRVNAGSINLSKFAELDRLAMHISSGRVSDISKARKRIKRIVSAEAMYQGPFFTLFNYAVFSAIFPVLMNGTWGECLAGFVGGLVVALIVLGKEKFKLLDRIGNGLSALISAIVAMAFRFMFLKAGGTVHIDVLMVSLAGCIMLLPGLGLTIAVEELSHGHLMSGVMRTAASFVRIIELGFGMLIADRLDLAINKEQHVNYGDDNYIRQEIPLWVKALILPVLILSKIIIFRAPKYISAYLFITIACFVAFFGNLFLKRWLGSEVGSVVIAFLVGFTANIYTLISKRPNNVVTICAIVFLVPGYMSASMISGLIVKDVNTSVNLLFGVTIACVSLVTGLQCAETLWPKKRGMLAY
ncbi:hypothetical protein AKO1_015369 [Acrasis kona]|uniref:Threonine/serine exporter-like N-terminal domain-containing protein n=1 Tax=Acrasis kona TaxID=1008807 RepID=A0AAW2ZFR9_9EUKA